MNTSSTYSLATALFAIGLMDLIGVVIMSDDDYTERFTALQARMKALLTKCPPGVQNWDYEKSVRFKKHLKKVEAAIKLLPKSKHVDFLKLEQLSSILEGYYK